MRGLKEIPDVASFIRATLATLIRLTRCAQASPQQLGGNLELRRERVILGLDLGIGEQTGFQLFELDCHVTSFARRRGKGQVSAAICGT
jgi:hypothetical protein